MTARRSIRSAAAVVLLAASAACARLTPPPSTAEERAAATVRPAIVYVETQWTAWVRDQRDGLLWHKNPTELQTGCTGFIVSPDGYIVTAGHCVDPGTEGIAPAVFSNLISRLVNEGRYEAADGDDLFGQMSEASILEGRSAGEPPERTVYVQRGVATSGLTSGESSVAQVVAFLKGSAGDVTLLKIEKADLPTVPLASADVSIGTPILAVGYPGSAEAVSDVTLEPTNKDGKISAKRTVGGIPFYEMSAAATHGMSGGPVVELNGRVVGLVSFAPTGEPQAFNFIVPSSFIRQVLARNGVKPHAGAVDEAYLSGLDLYFKGDYDKAAERLDQALDILPSHQQAQEFRAKARAGARTGGGSGMGAVALPVAVVLLLAGGAAGAVLVRRRRPARAQLPPPVQEPPAAETPATSDSTEACPACGEPRRVGASSCARCGSSYDRTS